MSVEVTVRPVSTDDAESVREALDSVARERRFILTIEAPAIEDVQRFIAESIRCNQPYQVAVEEKKVVGFCAIERRKEAGFAHVGRLGMGVIAGYRRKSIGRELLNAAVGHAARVGITRVELEVFSSNTAAISLYENFGFKKEGVHRRARYLDGIWDDMVQMALLATGTPAATEQPRSPIVARIERETETPGLAAVLERMRPTDLQSLLLEVQRVRAGQRRPSVLLSEYAQSRFVRPSKARVSRLLEWESLACSSLPDGFEAIELSPVCPLGTSSVVASVTQNWAVSTVRNTEVVSDPTNVLALECAMRRKRMLSVENNSSGPIHVAARQRVLRPQFYNDSKLATHFSIFALCSAGRDLGGRRFEVFALAQHVRFHIEVLRKFLGSEVRIIVSLSDFAPGDDREALERGFLQPIRDEFTNVTCVIDNERQSGRGYYRDLCCKIHVRIKSGEKIEVADGGSVDWTSKLLSNAKERLVISGIGSERVCEIAELLRVTR
jgi:RimJ/RimL family protein N-acetyltransferase